MWTPVSIFFIGSLLHGASSQWACSVDLDCSSLAGSVCANGICGCPAGLLAIQGGTVCGEWSPYLTSPCFDDHQCATLFASYQCLKENSTSEGACVCLPGNHYSNGRCWRNTELGEPCSRDEECQSTLRDPFSMVCSAGVCQCASGYYLRQRGECRKSGLAIGDGCVLDEDCRFENGACDIINFSCYDVTVGIPTTTDEIQIKNTVNMAANVQIWNSRQHGALCGNNAACVAPFQCSTYGACICPTGYYVDETETTCLAELGSASTAAQCVGLFAEVRDGICLCPANFYFDENMRDCIKATRRLTDSCVTDSMCHTFGAASRCGEPQQWEVRSCECIPDVSVWDEDRHLCRLFVGLGEPCATDSDCMIGDQQIVCEVGSTGQGVCVCPLGFEVVGDQCLTSGLVINDTCRETQECSGTANTVCEEGRCTCSAEYFEVNGACAAGIGGNCIQNSDCIVENTYCEQTDESFTCQCNEEMIESDGACYTRVSGYNASCTASVQCIEAIGEGSICENGHCLCNSGNHYRDLGCWPVTGLFEVCSRTSQCFLSDISDRVVCRNGLCQCQFEYPYSEQLHTCMSSATSHSVFGSMIISSVILLRLFLS